MTHTVAGTAKGASAEKALRETKAPCPCSVVPAKRGRKPLDSALPRDIVRYELPESKRTCVHDAHSSVGIGAEVSEQMHVIPDQVRVLQHHRI